METTSSPNEGMTTPVPVALESVVRALVSVEAGLASLQSTRELLLAMATGLAEVMADDGARPGGEGLWDSRALELAERSVAAEIATATRASDRTVQRQMGAAVELLEDFPVTFTALAEGRISAAQVRVIQDNGTIIQDPAARAGYEAAVLAAAATQAPGRLRRVAAREAEKARPEPLTVRHQRARAERRVWLNPLPDGMAELGAVLPAAVAHSSYNRLTRMAKARVESLRVSRGVAPEPRSLDQHRADLMADVLLHGAPAATDGPDGLLARVTARVEVTVPALTLIGSDEAVPAELDGRHPIDAETARVLAGAASAWDRVLTDPITGAVLAVDRYRASKQLRRLLKARDSRCRFPGCNIPAAELDLDHTHDAALGGPTELANLAGLCRRHHTLKHHTHWTPRQQGDGTLEWTSPTGRRYTDHPPTPATTRIPKPEPEPATAQTDPPQTPADADPPPF